MRQAAIALLGLVVLAGSAWAQMSMQEAEARLRARQAARDAPTTQPANTEARVAELAAQVEGLKKEVAALRTENAVLRRKLAEAGVKLAPAEERPAVKQVTAGLTIREVVAIMGRPSQIDDADDSTVLTWKDVLTTDGERKTIVVTLIQGVVVSVKQR